MDFPDLVGEMTRHGVSFTATHVLECMKAERWVNARVLLRHGVRLNNKCLKYVLEHFCCVRWHACIMNFGMQQTVDWLFRVYQSKGYKHLMNEIIDALDWCFIVIRDGVHADPVRLTSVPSWSSGDPLWIRLDAWAVEGLLLDHEASPKRSISLLLLMFCRTSDLRDRIFEYLSDRLLLGSFDIQRLEPLCGSMMERMWLFRMGGSAYDVAPRISSESFDQLLHEINHRRSIKDLLVTRIP